MSGPVDPSEQFNILNDKLERLLIVEEQLSTQMTKVNSHLDAHGKRLAQLEKVPNWRRCQKAPLQPTRCSIR
jgi:gamma-glutamylcysteine synthetase